MDEFDAELLAMVGGGEDESESGAEKMRAAKKAKESSSSLTNQDPVGPAAVPEKVDQDEAPVQRRGVAQKVKKSNRNKVSKQELDDDLNNLEDSPSPVASETSVPVEVEPVRADKSAESYGGQLYPIEGKFASEQERKDILSLPEIERESILAERAAESLKRQQDMQLKRALATSQAPPQTKRKGGAAEIDEDTVRKSSRTKVEKKSALDDYKRAREAKEAGKSSQRPNNGKPRGSLERSGSSASERDIERANDGDLYATSGDRGDDPIPDLRDFEAARIGRVQLAKWCFYPGFEDTMKGTYCRLNIGLNRDTGQVTYRMTQVRGFVTGKPYTVETANGKTLRTDQYAILAHGSAQRPWPFSACSNAPIQKPELETYRAALAKENTRLPRQTWLRQKVQDLNTWYNTPWSNERADAKFANQREMEKRVDPAEQLRVKRKAILKRKAEAEEKSDSEELARCDAELVALENAANLSRLKESTSVSNPAVVDAEQEEKKRKAELRMRAQMRREEEALQERLESRERLVRQRERATAEFRAREKLEAELKANGNLPSTDFTDLFGDSPNVSRSGTPASMTKTPEKAAKSKLSVTSSILRKDVNAKKPRFGAVGCSNRDDDILDLGIEEDI